jgi:hypothetical protein
MEFAARLRARGIDAWLDAWKIAPGDDFVESEAPALISRHLRVLEPLAAQNRLDAQGHRLLRAAREASGGAAAAAPDP